MEWILRALLIVLYILWLPAMLLQRALGRDPLQLKDPGTSSYWIARHSAATRESYFSESSMDEGFPTSREGGGPAVGIKPTLFSKVLRRVAAMFGPGKSET